MASALQWVKNKVYTFALKKLLGRFFEEVELEQLDVSLGSGELELFDLRLKTAVLNRLLASAPLRAVSGTVKRVRIAISLQNFLSESFGVEIDGVELTLEAAPAQAAATSSDASSPLLPRDALDDASALASSMEDESVYEADGEAIDESVQMLTQAIKQLSSNAKLAVRDVNVRLVASPSSESLELRIASIEVGEDDAPPHVTLQSSNGEGKRDTVLRHRYHKLIKFSGVSVRLVAADGSSAATIVELHNASENRARVGFQRRGDDLAGRVAEVELEIFMPLLRVNLGIAELTQLGDWARRFADAPVARSRAEADESAVALDASELQWPPAAAQSVGGTKRGVSGDDLADSAFASFLEEDDSRSMMSSSVFTDARSMISDDGDDGFHTCVEGDEDPFFASFTSCVAMSDSVIRSRSNSAASPRQQQAATPRAVHAPAAMLPPQLVWRTVVHVRSMVVALRSDVEARELRFELADGSFAVCQAASPDELRLDLSCSGLELLEASVRATGMEKKKEEEEEEECGEVGGEDDDDGATATTTILTIERTPGGAPPLVLETCVPNDPTVGGTLNVRCGALHTNVDLALLARWQDFVAACADAVGIVTPADAGGGGGGNSAAANVLTPSWGLGLSVVRASCAVRCPWPFPADAARRRSYAEEGRLLVQLSALIFRGDTRWRDGTFGMLDIGQVGLSIDTAAAVRSGGSASPSEEVRPQPIVSMSDARLAICTGAKAMRMIPRTAPGAEKHHHVFESPSDEAERAEHVRVPQHSELLAQCAVVIYATVPTFRVDCDHGALSSLIVDVLALVFDEEVGAASSSSSPAGSSPPSQSIGIVLHCAELEAVLREGSATHTARGDAFLLRVAGVVASAAITPSRGPVERKKSETDAVTLAPPSLQLLATARDFTLHLAPFGEHADRPALVPLVFKSPWGLGDEEDRDALVLWATARDDCAGAAGACEFSVLLRLQQITTRLLVESSDVEDSWAARLAAIFGYTDTLTRTIEAAAAAAFPADVDGAVTAATLAAVARPEKGDVKLRTHIALELIDGVLDHPPSRNYPARAMCAFRRVRLGCDLNSEIDEKLALELSLSDLEIYIIDVEPDAESLPPHLKRSGPPVLVFQRGVGTCLGGESRRASSSACLLSTELPRLGFVRIATLDNASLRINLLLVPSESLEPFDPIQKVNRVEIECAGGQLAMFACADVLNTLGELAQHTSSILASDETPATAPTVLVQDFTRSGAVLTGEGVEAGLSSERNATSSGGILSQIDEHAFDALVPSSATTVLLDFSFDDDAVLLEDGSSDGPSSRNERQRSRPRSGKELNAVALETLLNARNELASRFRVLHQQSGIRTPPFGSADIPVDVTAVDDGEWTVLEADDDFGSPVPAHVAEDLPAKAAAAAAVEVERYGGGDGGILSSSSSSSSDGEFSDALSSSDDSDDIASMMSSFIQPPLMDDPENCVMDGSMSQSMMMSQTTVDRTSEFDAAPNPVSPESAMSQSMSQSMVLETTAGVQVELEIGDGGELRHELAEQLDPALACPAQWEGPFDVIETHIPIPDATDSPGIFGQRGALFGATAADGRFIFRLKGINIVLHLFDGEDLGKRDAKRSRASARAAAAELASESAYTFASASTSASTSGGRMHDRSIEIVMTQLRGAVTDDAILPPTGLPPTAASSASESRSGPSVDIAVLDFEVFDRIEMSTLHRLVGHWPDEARHPRETGAHALQLRFGTEAAYAGTEEVHGDAHDIDVRVLPLRLNFGQTTLDFARALAERFAAQEPRRRGVERGSERGTAAIAIATATTATAAAPAPVFFRRVRVNALPIKLDFTPQRTRVSYSKLRSGDAVELASLVPLEGLEITLIEVDIHAVSGLLQAVELAADSWVADVVGGQLHKCVAGIGAWPVQSVAGAIDIAAGAANLVLLPLAEYRRGDERGGGGGYGGGGRAGATAQLSRAASSFARAATLHVLNAAALVSTTAAATLDTAERTLVGSVNGVGGEARGSAVRPEGMSDGIATARDVLSRQLHHTVCTVVAVPVREIRRGSAPGAVSSVIRAVPVAVLHPLIGATDAMSALLLGARNSLDPAALEDAKFKFKR